MSKINLIFSFVVVSLLFSIVGQGTSCHSKEGNMNNAPGQLGERLATGTWGGEHARLEVTESGARIDLDCAHGTIDQPIIIDAQGKFSVKGTFIGEHSGPVRRDEEPHVLSMRYAGELKDGTLTLTGTFDESGQNAGPYTLTHGNNGKVMKCR